MKKTIHVMQGLPGSGKTYWLANNKEAKACPQCHRDEIRDQLRKHYNSDAYFPVSEKEEYQAWLCACVSVIIAHPEATDFYFDQTSITNNAIAKFLNGLNRIFIQNHLPEIDEYNIIIESFSTPIEICLERNEHREGFEKVPPEVLKRMHKHFHVATTGLYDLLECSKDPTIFLYRHSGVKEDENPYAIFNF